MQFILKMKKFNFVILTLTLSASTFADLIAFNRLSNNVLAFLDYKNAELDFRELRQASPIRINDESFQIFNWLLQTNLEKDRTSTRKFLDNLKHPIKRNEHRSKKSASGNKCKKIGYKRLNHFLKKKIKF